MCGSGFAPGIRFTRWSLKMDRSPTPMFVNVGEDSKPWDGWNSLVKRYGNDGTDDSPMVRR